MLYFYEIMNELSKYSIPCPKCKSVSEHTIFHNLNGEEKRVALDIVSNKINFVTCNICHNHFQVKAEVLYVNRKTDTAVYFHPQHFQNIVEIENRAYDLLGKSFYLSNVHKFNNWDLFRGKINELEVLPFVVFQPKEQKTYPSYIPTQRGFSLRTWSCTICGGDESSGCLFNDPSECPRFT